MSENKCPQCGAPIDPGATECKFCGEKLAVQQISQQFQQSQQPQVIIQQAPQQIYVNGISPTWPVKNKIVAALLAIFLGSIGAHNFYLGKIGKGILCIIFAWTWIPAFLGIIKGIIYLCSNDENFQLKHHVRIK